ncbi:MAG: ribonuclease III [Burkholderiales bacterium]|nr:ribonuclease III [Burkholderiales bacterium]
MLPIDELEKRLGYFFKNPSLLKRAVTHRSYAAEHNERLEFLGDSVLNCVIGYALFKKDTHFNEGSLSRVRANLVKQAPLVEIGKRIGISSFLRVGDGELNTGGTKRPSIMADALEAIFGAVFCDGGFQEAQTVIVRLYEPMLSQLAPDTLSKDPKTLLQEMLQSKHLGLPLYEVLEITGAAHDQLFKVMVSVPKLGIKETGIGKSRRQAEQEAAHRAIESGVVKNL